jgi:acetyl esterase/lipase
MLPRRQCCAVAGHVTPGFTAGPFFSSSQVLSFDGQGGLLTSRRRLRHLVASRNARARVITSVVTDGVAESPIGIPSAEPEIGNGASGMDTPIDREETPADRLQAVLDSMVASVSSTFDTLVDPFVRGCSVLQGKWERVNGAYLLRPPGRAKGVIHFIGGAFLGKAPHISYRTFLELLADRGFCVVASSYDLRLDYLAITADIVSQWEAVETDLALDYGTIPVIGVGHSAGAVFHCIASSLFDDMTPKAGNVLISFNNKALREAIPLYANAVLPIARQSVFVESLLPGSFREAIESIPGAIDAAIEGSPVTPARFKTNFLPAIQDARAVVEQLQPLVRELGGVPRPNDALNAEEQASRVLEEFYPPPSDIASAISNMYDVNQTLIVKFSDDSLDESDNLLNLMRRRGDETTVSMMQLEGSHVTPIAQDLSISGQDVGDTKGGVAGDLVGLLRTVFQEGVTASWIRELTILVALIDEWVEAGIANDTL